MMGKFARRAVLAAFLVFVSVSLALADGAMFAKPDPFLVEAKPRISSQRAVIKYDGKTETIFVESVLDGPKGLYGWVVPLPAKPSFVKAVKPPYIEDSFRQIKPRVRTLELRDVGIPLFVAIFAALLFLTAAERYRNTARPERAMKYLAEGFVVGLVFLIGSWFQYDAASRPSEAATGGIPMDKKTEGGVDVQSYGTIGSYEVSALSASTGKPVFDWLQERSIPVPQNAISVIDDYAREGWAFLVAEFRKDSDRPWPPHPLKAVFDTDRPVYPMRLTGTQDAPLHLELLVIGPRQATIEGLNTWRCTNGDILVYVRKEKSDEGVFDDWVGSSYAMARYGMVTTYMRADLTPNQMKKDFAIGWKPYERLVVEVYDRDQALRFATLTGIFWLPICAFVLGALPLLIGPRFWPMIAATLASLAIAFSIAASWYARVEKVETEDAPINASG